MVDHRKFTASLRQGLPWMLLLVTGQACGGRVAASLPDDAGIVVSTESGPTSCATSAPQCSPGDDGRVALQRIFDDCGFRGPDWRCASAGVRTNPEGCAIDAHLSGVPARVEAYECVLRRVKDSYWPCAGDGGLWIDYECP